MSPELIAIIATVITLAGLILNGQRSLRQDLGGRIDRLEQGQSELRARLASFEASVEARLTAVEKSQGKLEAGQNELRERMAHLEGLLNGLREAIFNKAA